LVSLEFGELKKDESEMAGICIQECSVSIQPILGLPAIQPVTQNVRLSPVHKNEVSHLVDPAIRPYMRLRMSIYILGKPASRSATFQAESSSPPTEVFLGLPDFVHRDSPV
jgi:hypothetical protein